MIEKKELSLEELIEIASRQDKEPSKGLNEIEQFIDDLGVVADKDNKVPNQNIHWAYRIWCKSVGRVPKTRYKFFRDFAKYFERIPDHRRHQFRGFYVNPEPFFLTEKEIKQMRRFYKSEIKKKTSPKQS